MSKPIVTITDSFDAIVDGKNWGKFGDVVVNNKSNAELLVEVNLAVMAKAAAVKSAADTAVKAATDKAAEDVAAAKAAQAAAETEKTAEAARVAAIVTALKGVDLKTLPAPVQTAILSKAEAERAAMIKQKAAIEAALAKV